MGLFGGGGDKFSTIEITEDWINSGALSPDDELSNAIYVKPHEDDGGINVGTNLLTSLHNPKIGSKGLLGRKSVNNSDEVSFEITYSREAMGFKFAAKSEPTIQTVETQLESLLPNSEFERQEPQLLDFRSGRHVSACELGLRDYTLRPLKHKELEGFNTDPLGQIAAQMIGLVDDQKAPAEVAVQTVLKPAERSWTQGVNGEGDINTIAANLEEENIVNPWHPTKYRAEDPSDLEKKTAKLVRNQSGRHGWWFNVRIIAVSEDPEEAKRRVRETAGMYRRFYLSETEQGFEPLPRSGDAIKACVEDAVQRHYTKPSQPMVKSENEVAGFVHIPDGDFSTRDLERSTTKGDEGVPPTLPQFKHVDQTGYTDKEIPRKSWEQQNSDDYEWPYWPQMESASDYIPVNAHEYGMEAREPGEEGDIYSGAYPRAMIENATNDTEQPYWVGLDSNYKPVPILHRETFRHLFVTGQTGTGKSTFVLNRLMQHAYKGHGFAFVDPGGEDCFELMKMLPEDRLDDVVFIDITNSGPEGNTERHIGFNFLETHHDPGEKGFSAEVEGIVSDILPLLEADQYQRMKGVAANILRALIRANHAETGYTYTLLDMYYILASEEGRQRYARFVREEQVDQFLETFADEVAELEDSDLEPLIRRLQTWIENAMIRPIVSERNPQFSIANTVEEDKILIIKCDTSKDVRQMVSSTITRKIWSVVTARPSRTEKFLAEEDDIQLPAPLREASAAMGGKGGGTKDGEDGTSPKANADAGEIHVDDLDLSSQEVIEHDNLMLRPDGRVEADMDAQAEHDPYYLVIDELHSVLSDESQVEQMLAEARKKRLGLILLTQQTVQLKDYQKRQIMSNCSTLMAFNPGQDGSERRAIADGFSGLTKDDLGVDNYHAWTMVTDKEGTLSEPFQSRMFPQYPPRRGRKDLKAVIEGSLDEYGTEIKSTQQIHGEVPDEFGGGGMGGGMDIGELLGAGSDGEGGGLPGGAGAEPGESTEAARANAMSEQGKQALYEAIHTIQVRSDCVGDFVASEDVKEEWQRRTGDMGYDSIPSNLIEQDPYITRSRRGGDVVLNLTPEGMEAAGLTFNTGSSASGGKDHHRMVLEFSYQAFTKLGLETWLPEQEGDEEADGMADLPIDPSEADNFRAMRDLEQKARDQLIDAVGTDAAMDFTDGRHISIEAETSTMRAPEQTLTNLRKALDEERFCVFACKDEWASDKGDTFYWPKRGEKIIYDTYRDGRSVVPDHSKKTFARELNEEGNRTFYNRKKGFFHIGDEEEGVYVLRKRTQAEQDRDQTTEIYWEEEQDGSICLRDRGISDGEGGYIQEPQTHLRFDGPEDLTSVERADVGAYYSYDSSEEVYIVRADGNREEYETEEELLNKWSRFYPPFVPEVHFPREPEEDDWAMVVFPDSDNPEYDEPIVYHQGETWPLLPEEVEMPEVPDPEEIQQVNEEAEEVDPEAETGGESSESGPAGPASEQEGAVSATEAGGESEAVAELADAVVEASDVSREQAVIGADSLAETPMDWETKVDMAANVAQNVTGATDGGTDTNTGGAETQAQPADTSAESTTQPDALDDQQSPASPSGQADQQAGSQAESSTASEDSSQASGSSESAASVDPTDASASVGGFSRVGDERPSSGHSQDTSNGASAPATSNGANAPTNGQGNTGGADESAQPTHEASAESANETTTDPEPDVDDQVHDPAEAEGEPTPEEDRATPEDTPDESAEDGAAADTETPVSTSEQTNQKTETNPDSTPEADAEPKGESGEDTRTVSEKLDDLVDETEPDSDEQQVKDLTTVMAGIGGKSEIEAFHDAQRQVYDEVRYETPETAEVDQAPKSPDPAQSPSSPSPTKVDQSGGETSAKFNGESVASTNGQPTDHSDTDSGSAAGQSSTQPESTPEEKATNLPQVDPDQPPTDRESPSIESESEAESQPEREREATSDESPSSDQSPESDMVATSGSSGEVGEMESEPPTEDESTSSEPPADESDEDDEITVDSEDDSSSGGIWQA